MIDNKDKIKSWFLSKLWVLNSKGSTPDEAFSSYRNVLLNDTNPINNKKYEPEELLKKYKDYKSFKISEKSEFVKGGHEPLLSISDYFKQEVHKQDFKIEKEPNIERDVYLFGRELI